MVKSYLRARVGCIPVLIPSSDLFCNIASAISPPVRMRSVVAHRGYASWMLRLRTPDFFFYFFTMLSILNVRRAARLLRLSSFWREKEIVVVRPSPFLFPATAVPSLHVGGESPFDTDMALNRAQMLVRNSEALAQFRVDHRIPDDIVIERPGPNDDADWVEGEGNRMPIRTWFIYQAGLRFPLSKLLRTVLSICGLTFMQISVNFVRTVLAVEALMQREGLEFTAEDLFHVYFTDSPDKDQYLNNFTWVSGQWEFPADGPDPFSVPRHRGYVPVESPIYSVTSPYIGIPSLLEPLIRGVPFFHLSKSADQAQGQGVHYLTRSVIYFEGTSAELRRLLEEAEGESSGSNESSSSSWDIDLGNEALNEDAKVEDGEEVDQVPAAVPLVPAPLVPSPEPVNLPSSDSDVAIVEPREIVEHSYSHSGSSSSGSQLNAEIMASKVRILRKKQGPVIEPPTLPEAPVSSTPAPVEDQSIALSLMGGKRKGKQPTEGTSRPKRGKGAGLAAGTPELWAPQFAAMKLDKQVTSADTSKDHETCIALGNALKQGVVDLKKANQKANSLEKELKQTQSELADARSAAEIAILQRNHAQQEASDLKAFACGEVYKKLFDRAFKQAGDVYERQLAELRPGVFQEGWLACLKELQIPLDHPAWSSPAPPANSLPLRSDIHQSTCPTSTKRSMRPYLLMREISTLRILRVPKSCGSDALSRGNYPQGLKESIEGRVLRFLQYSMTGTWFHYHSEWKARARLTVLL
ncbi:hypothetical protein Acr_00g0049540 [Actinidia rufa]|uniref:Uncharacterized protein n=1 Tax=Actinidia rufa TaxID=165716 RepID=A0A7J0DKA1_9ERIC|nr:hypothetical protein Acr_00g0049540 [Actinidia rufa]